MKIFIGHSRDMDYEKEIYEPIRNCAIYDMFTFIFPYENSVRRNASKKDLRQYDLFIADVSSNSTELGIELVWAKMMNVPIRLLHKEGTDPSPALHELSEAIEEYKNEDDFVKKLTWFVYKFDLSQCYTIKLDD